MRRSCALALAALLAALMAPGMAAAESPRTPVVLRIGTIGDLAHENPFGATAGSDWTVATIQYAMLRQFSSEDGSPEPGLAETCEPNSDHTEWVCRLREGLRWSDGTPLTARDVAFSYRFVIDNGIPQYRSYFPFEPEFETPDDRTLVWRAQRPTFAPDIPPWVYVVPEHVWAPYDGRDRKEIRNAPNVPAVGSGPFVLTSHQRGQGWTMERNPHFWGSTPAVDRLEFRLYQNEEALAQALRSGEVDVADSLAAPLFNALDGAPGIRTHRVVADWWLNLAFNFGGQSPDADPHPALSDLTVRRAIAMSIDKREIVEKVYLGLAEPGDTVIRPASAYWHLDIPEDEELPYDPVEANRLLDEAGYLDTDGDGVREDPESGRPFTLLMPASEETTGAVDAGRLIVGYLREIGMDVELQPASDAKMNDYWSAGDFDMYIWYWSGDPDPDYQLSVFTAGLCGVWSDGCWSHPRFEALYERQRNVFDREARREVVFEAQRFLYEQIPVIVLAYPNTLQAYRSDRFENWTTAPGPDGYITPVYSFETLLTVRPVSSTAAATSRGFPTWLWAAAAGTLAALLLLSTLRKRSRRAAEG